jgi:hypothetical protein
LADPSEIERRAGPGELLIPKNRLNLARRARASLVPRSSGRTSWWLVLPVSSRDALHRPRRRARCYRYGWLAPRTPGWRLQDRGRALLRFWHHRYCLRLHGPPWALCREQARARWHICRCSAPPVRPGLHAPSHCIPPYPTQAARRTRSAGATQSSLDWVLEI